MSKSKCPLCGHLIHEGPCKTPVKPLDGGLIEKSWNDQDDIPEYHDHVAPSLFIHLTQIGLAKTISMRRIKI